MIRALYIAFIVGALIVLVRRSVYVNCAHSFDLFLCDTRCALTPFCDCPLSPSYPKLNLLFGISIVVVAVLLTRLSKHSAGVVAITLVSFFALATWSCIGILRFFWKNNFFPDSGPYGYQVLRLNLESAGTAVVEAVWVNLATAVIAAVASAFLKIEP